MALIEVATRVTSQEMKAVGIEALRDNLSRFLKEVQAGEHIWVTDRDEIIAEIHRPISPVAGRVDRWQAFLNAEEQRGQLRRASAPDAMMQPLPPLPANIDRRRIREDARDDLR